MTKGLEATRGIDRRSFIRIAAGGAALIAVPAAPVWAQAARHGKMEYGVASIDSLYSAIYVTLKQGYFATEGLDVSYINSQSGPRSKQMLAAGQLFITTTGVNDSVALSLAGKASTVVFSLDRRVPFANILVHKDNFGPGKLQAVKDLAGKSIAVTQPQAATWLMAIYIADRAGIKDKVTVRGLGDFVTMLGAVKSKQVEATIATISMIDAAKQEGWGVPLFDVTDEKTWNETFGGDVPGVGCYVLSENIAKRAPAIQAFVNAMVKGQDWVKANSTEKIVDLIYQDYLSGFPREAVVRAVNVYKGSLWNYTNVLPKETYDRLIRIMGDGRQFSNEELKAVPYEKSVDMSFVRKARNL
jgi:NitT/TauT family transport system substrate-binding protein